MVPNLETSNRIINIINESITEESKIVSILPIEIPATQFEVGSFPSLSPSPLTMESLEDVHFSIEDIELDFEYVYRPLYNLMIYLIR